MSRWCIWGSKPQWDVSSNPASSKIYRHIIFFWLPLLDVLNCDRYWVFDTCFTCFSYLLLTKTHILYFLQLLTATKSFDTPFLPPSYRRYLNRSRVMVVWIAWIGVCSTRVARWPRLEQRKWQRREQYQIIGILLENAAQPIISMVPRNASIYIKVFCLFEACCLHLREVLFALSYPWVQWTNLAIQLRICWFHCRIKVDDACRLSCNPRNACHVDFCWRLNGVPPR